MWKLFENFLVDICRVSKTKQNTGVPHEGDAWYMSSHVFIYVQVCNNTSDRKHADTMLECYVTETVMSIVTCFFSSPFSDQSTSLQVIERLCCRSFHTVGQAVVHSLSQPGQMYLAISMSVFVFLTWRFWKFLNCLESRTIFKGQARHSNEIQKMQAILQYTDDNV